MWLCSKGSATCKISLVATCTNEVSTPHWLVIITICHPCWSSTINNITGFDIDTNVRVKPLLPVLFCFVSWHASLTGDNYDMSPLLMININNITGLDIDTNVRVKPLLLFLFTLWAGTPHGLVIITICHPCWLWTVSNITGLDIDTNVRVEPLLLVLFALSAGR